MSTHPLAVPELGDTVTAWSVGDLEDQHLLGATYLGVTAVCIPAGTGVSPWGIAGPVPAALTPQYVLRCGSRHYLMPVATTCMSWVPGSGTDRDDTEDERPF